MVGHQTYLLIGEDEISKGRKIDALKKTLFKDGIEEFNLDVFYGKELSLARLKEALNKLPVFSQKRLVIIKDISRLLPAQKTFLTSYLKSPYKHIVLILEALNVSGKDTFVTNILPLVETLRFKTQRQANVFDLGRTISQGKTALALRILSGLLDGEKQPLRILGGLFWQWQKDKARFSLSAQKRQLKLFMDTDLGIKSGRLKPELALELLVINLSQRVSSR